MWLLKIANGLTLMKGNHSVNKKPVYYFPPSPETRQLRPKLKAMGFQWYRPKHVVMDRSAAVGNWIYESYMTPQILQGLQHLGADVSVAGGSPDASPQPEAPVEEPQQVQEVTDQSWEGANNAPNSYSRRKSIYVFPIKDNIYTTDIEVDVDGYESPVVFTVIFHRRNVKGTGRENRRVPLYLYEIIDKETGKHLTKQISRYDDDAARGASKKRAPNEWGLYSETNDVIKPILEILQTRVFGRHYDEQGNLRIDQNGNPVRTKTYNLFDRIRQVNARSPELKKLLVHMHGRDEDYNQVEHTPIIKNIRLDTPGYEGEYPVQFTSSHNFKSLYAQTALDHPLAPHPKHLYYALTIPLEVKTPEQLHAWLDDLTQNPNNPELQEAKENYLDYLKSFAFTEEEQRELKPEMDLIMGYISRNQVDIPFLKQKLMGHGYIRPSKRRKKNVGPGMVPQDEIDIVFDHKKIIAVAYSNDRRLRNSPEYFYAALAYYMSRWKRNVDDSVFSWLYTVIGDFAELATKYDPSISPEGVRNYFDKAAASVYADITGRQPPRSRFENMNDFYSGFNTEDQGQQATGTPASGQSALNSFVNYVTGLDSEIDPEYARNNPKSVYRQLALKYHPDQNENTADVFVELSKFWNALPDTIKRAYSNWLIKISS